MIWKSMTEHFRVPIFVRLLLVDQLLSAAIYNIFSIGRTYTIIQVARRSEATGFGLPLSLLCKASDRTIECRPQ
jgi:hypothetical protein